MKTKFFTFLFLLLSGGFFLAAQTGLPDSKRHSFELFVYKASVANLREINLKGKKPDEKMLQSLVISYARDEPVPPLPRGNYFIVGAEENQLVFNDYTVDDIYFKLVPGEQFRLCLYDSTGHFIRNAKVRCGAQRLRFDRITETYTCKDVKNEQVIEVNNDGVFHYIEIKKGDIYRYYSKNNFFKKELWRIQRRWYTLLNVADGLFHPDKDKYTGFIAFSKPMYKPGETVKMKAYMAGIKGRPYNKPLNIRLYGFYPLHTDTTLVENLLPYRPGMYQYEFKLTGDLNLKLDSHYSIALHTNDKRTNEINGSFRYEEYELNSARFTVETTKQEFAAGDTVILKVKASDENEMASYGGKVELLVTPAQAPFAIKNMNKERTTFIPNVLWSETVEMNETSEKEIIIPDSIFPAGISLFYDVKCTYLSADNEKREQTKRLFRNADDYVIVFSMDKGLLTINELHKGIAQQAQATIKILGENGESVFCKDFAPISSTVSNNIISLPCQFAVPWIASSVEVQTNNSFATFSLADMMEEQLGYQFYLRNDSVVLKVDNPAQIPFWYTLRRNNREIAKGYTTHLDYAVRDNGKDGFGMQLSYLFGKERLIESAWSQFKKNMTIDVSTPTVVYPGQKTTVTVSVSDKKGQPVENADVTAYAFTSKFQDYSIPNLIIKGKNRYAKPFTNIPYKWDKNGVENQPTSLTWAYWRHVMSLDTIEYYRFLYPDIYYSYTEPSADGTTQIAPYIVINGALQGAHLLQIDDRLHYAAQTQHYAPYLFRVTPGIHTLRFRTHNREVSVHNILIKEGMKTILSFDAGIPYYKGLNPSFVFISKLLKKKQQGWFSQNEIDYLSTQMITIDNNFGKMILPGMINIPLDLPVYLNAGDINYFLNPVERTQYNPILRTYTNSPILAGPFPNRHIVKGLPDMVNVVVDRKPLATMQFEGGFHYTLNENFLKMQSWRQSPLTKQAPPFVPFIDFNARFHQQNDIHNYFNNRIINILTTGSGLIDYKENYNSNKSNDCLFNLFLAANQDSSLSLPTFILFVPQHEEDTLAAYSLYMGGARNFRNLREGDMTIHLVFGDTTSITSTIHLLRDGQNYLKIDSFRRDDDNKMAIATFNLFERNVRISLPDNLYSSTNATVYNENHINELTTRLPILLNRAPKEGTALEEVVVIAHGSTRNFRMLGAVASKKNTAPPPPDSAPISASPITELSKMIELSAPPLTDNSNSMRRNFHDDAFWQPALKTNDKGEASFEVTYPDDITNWQAHFLAIGNRKQADKKQINIQSFKALTARLSVPRFAIRGDSLHAVGRIANHLNDTIEVRQIITHDDNRQESSILMTTSHVQQIPLTVTDGDSVTLAYFFSRSNGYFDGEERSFPVFEPGLLQSFGSFKIINDTTTSIFEVDPDLGLVTIHAEASGLDVFRREIDKIDRYPYYCNEQMASKIKVLLAKKIICNLLNEPFKEEDKIRDLITRLNKNRNSDGMWGWWNISHTEDWITHQVINAMLDAEKAGYKTEIDTEKLLTTLERELKEGITSIPLLVSSGSSAASKQDEAAVVKQELLNRLILLKKLNARIDFTSYLTLINYHFPSTTLKEMELYALLGMNKKINTDTLFLYARHTMLGSMYWETMKDDDSKRFTFRSPSNNTIENTLTAYFILKHLGGHEAVLEKIRNYFFECRHDASWQNTYQASRIIETIMQDMLDKDINYSEVAMYINGERVTKFPYTEKIHTQQPALIRKEGTLPLFVTVYQQDWNRNPEPESSKGFTVQTRLKDANSTGTDLQSMQATRINDTLSALIAGKPAMLEVSVTIEADANYVQIEVPIPAGCTYDTKTVGFYGKEAHREYFKEKVTIFCNRLNKGEHLFTIELLPRFSGRYTLNPTKAELMYFPVFYGNNIVKTIYTDL